MAKYVPLTVSYAESGLKKDKAAFVLADDAFQQLQNAYNWRGRIRRRQGFDKLGRLRRIFAAASYFDSGASPWTIDLLQINGYITDVDISGAPTCIITTSDAHGLSNGDSVVISSVVGTTELNGNTYTIANVTATTFEVTQAGPTAYTSGGFFYSDRDRSGEGDANVECGSVVIVVDVGGTPETFTDQGDGTLDGSLGNSGTINYVTGTVILTGAAAAAPTTLAYNYYPSLPVMGIPQREQDTINVEQTIAFDTKYAYEYNSGVSGFREIVATNPKIWTGNNSDFFYSTNFWRDGSNNKYFWTTNFNSSDPIRLYNGTEWSGASATLGEFEPNLDSGGTNKLFQARMLIPYKGRMVALNTWEGTSRGTALQRPQRARWSQNGDPTDLTDGWRSDVAGRGGYVDCPISEHIIGAEFIRDQLIVTFERSTWLLRYTGNEILPFSWERLNRELGADSTFSTVPFDDGILYVGDKAIVACDGNNVTRIDDAIPDEVFDFHNNNNGPRRVHGIRNFFERLVFWAYRSATTEPTAGSEGTFPNRVLVFNYHNNTWAEFTDSFTTFGTWQRSDDRTWSSMSGKTWESQSNPWNNPEFQADFPAIVAGNQQGYVHVLEQNVRNTPSLAINGITLSAAAGNATILDVPNHNLQEGEWVYVSGCVGQTNFPTNINEGVYRVGVTDGDTLTLTQKPQVATTAITKATQAVITAAGHTLQVDDWCAIRDVSGMTEINGRYAKVTAVTATTVTVDIDSTTFTTYTSGGYIQNMLEPMVNFDTSGTSNPDDYLGCGELTRLMNYRIRSKKFNLIKQGRKNMLGHIDFLVKVTQVGEVTCSIFTDYVDNDELDDRNLLNDRSINQSSGDTFFNRTFLTQVGQFSQDGKVREWKRFYCPTDAQFFEFVLTLDQDQMANRSIVDSEYWMDAFIIYSSAGGRLAE